MANWCIQCMSAILQINFSQAGVYLQYYTLLGHGLYTQIYMYIEHIAHLQCTCTNTFPYHRDEDGESGHDFWPEPVGRLDVLFLLKNWVVHKELLTSIFLFAVADISLDLLFKLRPSSFLQTHIHVPIFIFRIFDMHVYMYIHVYIYIYIYIYTCIS